MSQPMLRFLDSLQKTIADMDQAIKKRNLRKTELAFARMSVSYNSLKDLLPEDFQKENFGDFDRHMHFIEHFLGKKDFEWIKSNFVDISVRDFPKVRSRIYDIVGPKKISETTTSLSKNVFIVHGKDRKPLRELKTMLSGFGLNPVVLHEQPSGSRTIVEKLEKYSDVGYAFVILTPDDIGYESDLFLPRVHGRPRARQNVVLEFGYFIGSLGRDKVCCLYKGNIELPSDMQGIVYIPFKESVDEARDMIIKEVKAAGYTIKE